MSTQRVSSAWPRVYKSFHDRVSSQLAVHAPRRRVPSRLYHFTDCDGLIGILKNKNVRGSLATSLNDSSETQHGVSLARDLLAGSSLRTKSLPTDRLREALLVPRWRHYVISFCGRSDTALHWLHYGRSGSGVAVGFDVRALRRAAKLQQFKLYPIIYSEEKQQEWLGSVVGTVDATLTSRLKQLTRKLDVNAK